MPDGLDALGIGDELDWDPQRLVPPAPWVGHIPFAFWLVNALRPASFVELGTHSGNSYFAFCQALSVFCPSARAYAVDTWEGDEHAGAYGEDVFGAVSAHNRAHYAGLSTLLRSTFDAARGYFGDAKDAGGVDLLHIDGMHTYDAVRHDFEAWQDTLSGRGVVLFHDTNVRERGFGVWRFWEEVRSRHPHFEFSHSNGLGVLGVGPDQAPALQALFTLPRDAAASLRRRIASRGEAFQRKLEAEEVRAEARAQAAKVGQEQAATIAALGHATAALAAALDTRDAIIVARDRTAAQLAADLRGQREDFQAAIAQAQGEREAALAAAERARHEAAAAAAEAASQAEARVAAVASAYVNSFSWRLTRPVRVASRLLRGQDMRPRPVAPPSTAAAASPPPPPTAGPPAPTPSPAPAPAPGGAVQKAAMRALFAARLNTFLSGSGTLRLPRAEGVPDVSIVLVLYNQADLTFACLGSILETLGGGPAGTPGIEVLIVDNGSTDETPALLDRIEGATIVRNPSNLHFLRAVNLAARSATGRTLLLLNNDAQLLPGSLPSALRTLDSSPSIGAVGGRIVLPDGTLQEAGSIIWRDGTCLGYGRGEDPGSPDFMFQRDVDYCSGAFLLTRMDAWRELGGFDERYAPAYYEETDYCVRLWKSGRRVVFDPDAAVVHYEFGSAAGADAALVQQAANHTVFAAQHEDWLEGQFPADPVNVFAARTARGNAPRVLVLEDRVPKLELGTGYPRANRLLHELVGAGAEVTLFPMHRHHETWRSVRRALDKRIEVLIAADGTQVRAYLEARQGHFDAILVCRPPNMAVFERAVGYDRDRLIGKATVLYDAEALFVTRSLQKLEAAGRPASEPDRHRLVASEVALTRLADAVISVSPAEQALLEAYGARNVHLLGHALDEQPIPTGFLERDRIVFLGAIQADDAPNADAVKWFADEILPGVRQHLRSDLPLHVIGLVKSPIIRAMEGNEREGGPLRLVGMVDDLPEALASARVMVVPSRLGAGIPHKVHQAAMLGIPMVVTSLIAGQLGWQDGVEVLVADDAEDFARACARLYEDQALWEGIRRRALDQAREECAPEAFTATVRRILAEVPLTRRRPEPVEKLPPGHQPEVAAEPEAARPAEADFSVGVPFHYPSVIPTPPPRVGVICHLFYPEIGPEVLRYLGNLPVPADLFLSTDTKAKAAEIRSQFGSWAGGTVEVLVVPNRGRDIAPKLVGFGEVHDRHDLVLHLHSKASHHADFLAPWRSFLFEGLLGSPEVVSSILDAFGRLPKLGMVAPQHFEPVRPWLGWTGNYAIAEGLAGLMGIELKPGRALDFPSGSMFWARPAALRPLLDLRLKFENFVEEKGQKDHTLAHAVERLYFLACERSGHTWLKVAQPELYHDASTIVEMFTPASLHRFVAEHGVALTGPKPIPVRPHAPPLATQAPPGLLKRLAARGG